VAATKSFTAQLIALFALAVHLGSVRRSLTAAETRRQLDDLMALPEKVQQVLATDEQTKVLARQFEEFNSFMFLGRDISYPIALEGALKLKETAYIHAEGFPTGEMKHGPNALVDENLPVVMILTRDVNDPEAAVRYQKSVSLLREIAARGTRVIVVANPDDAEVRQAASHIIPIPNAPSLLLPVLEIIPLQLLAYHIAVLRGVNVDHPRNLSKSVITE
jgi:glucosamine--fructose-6-phosphate aminotransferase (isomerizing)